MARQGRNERCSCGSGKKAKYCCGSWRGPSPDALDEAFIAAALRDSRLALIGATTSRRVDEYLEELVGLPSRFPGLGVELPWLVDLPLEALLHACAIGYSQVIDEMVPKVPQASQAVPERARLARELVRLRDEGQLSRFLVAVGLFDLSRTPSVLVEAAVLRAAKVRAGVARTASGLLIAS